MHALSPLSAEQTASCAARRYTSTCGADSPQTTGKANGRTPTPGTNITTRDGCTRSSFATPFRRLAASSSSRALIDCNALRCPAPDAPSPSAEPFTAWLNASRSALLSAVGSLAAAATAAAAAAAAEPSSMLMSRAEWPFDPIACAAACLLAALSCCASSSACSKSGGSWSCCCETACMTSSLDIDASSNVSFWPFFSMRRRWCNGSRSSPPRASRFRGRTLTATRMRKPIRSDASDHLCRAGQRVSKKKLRQLLHAAGAYRPRSAANAAHVIRQLCSVSSALRQLCESCDKRLTVRREQVGSSCSNKASKSAIGRTARGRGQAFPPPHPILLTPLRRSASSRDAVAVNYTGA
eukprot:1497623-Pleurochrysis_carterae.AAC.2